jgi:hypothetical protein
VSFNDVSNPEQHEPEHTEAKIGMRIHGKGNEGDAKDKEPKKTNDGAEEFHRVTAAICSHVAASGWPKGFLDEIQ